MGTFVTALCAGFVFGAGLALSEMTNPAKVQNFLDFLGTWDPSLAFVMAAALACSAGGYRIARRLRSPWLAPAFPAPTRTALDPELVFGAALFGVGWGLGGFCPGPALAGLPQSVGGVYVFVAAMIVGVALHRWAYTPLRTRRGRSRDLG
jgi:uncharacterized membrane protein YedE/YeeE